MSVDIDTPHAPRAIDQSQIYTQIHFINSTKITTKAFLFYVHYILQYASKTLTRALK